MRVSLSALDCLSCLGLPPSTQDYYGYTGVSLSIEDYPKLHRHNFKYPELPRLSITTLGFPLTTQDHFVVSWTTLEGYFSVCCVLVMSSLKILSLFHSKSTALLLLYSNLPIVTSRPDSQWKLCSPVTSPWCFYLIRYPAAWGILLWRTGCDAHHK